MSAYQLPLYLVQRVFEYRIFPDSPASGLLVPALTAESDTDDRPLFRPRLTVLLDLVLYTDTLYFRLEYICCMERELSSGFLFHFSGAVRTMEMDFSSVVKAIPGGPICVSKNG